MKHIAIKHDLADITLTFDKFVLQVDWNAPPREGCVLYIGHIPHGFYEEQMKGFFGQFGIVTRVRLSRSKKVRGLL
jgi:nucleolar protein 15